MKKNTAKTISILSLVVMLSVSTSNVFAVCGHCRQGQVQYAASAAAQPKASATEQSAQGADPAPTQDAIAVDAQPVLDVSFVALLWKPLATFVAELL